MLPCTVGTQAVFGYGLWNGRSLTDCAPDVMFSLATNTALSTVVTKESVPFKPAGTFPDLNDPAVAGHLKDWLSRQARDQEAGSEIIVDNP